MSALIRNRLRLYSAIWKNNRQFSSNAATEPPREPIVSSSVLGDQTPQPPSGSPTPPPASKAKSSWSFLKYGLIAAVTGGIATAGYATYAYSLDEIDQKTKVFRAYADYNVVDDASSLDKFQAYLRVAAVTVPAKLVEIYLDLRRLAEEHVRGFTEPTSDKLLPDLHPLEQHVFTLVLDLNETLIYSDWKRERGWRSFKRPGVDAFLEHLAQFYEIVVYSDQLSMYVDPVVERLDTKHCIRYRLSRGATRYVDGKHYRDLSKLNRDPAKVIYISGHALESSLQPENCIPIKPWQGEADDTALLDLIPFLEYVAKHRPAEIRNVIASYQGRDIAKEFIERSKEHQRRMQEQKQQGRFWRR
ncbi:TFIIF-interacting CTD phosphatase, including NLI-interacting factor [Handroanthus impetiginosus]|uniref:Mitochondrial import inner membrane translocase subunit TIM50 n=1 Tax=Handroanthus impetiginosus TaxID=429701 RepID=A0A2G9G9L4_9LAMI|nr:TFIIF-interacting CTD phosphatase, including NLI-interacting factor [Handroanthus impetiginosus]